MIPLQRPDLNPKLAKQLAAKSSKLQEISDVATARDSWRSARAVRRDLQQVLCLMAAGFSRCMYCGDSQGTDIDHFKPIARDPSDTFSWVNHFLSCSYCNSNQKRDQYPCGADGECLLVDPSLEDPCDHMNLTLPTGKYTGFTLKGHETIRVFGLSRPDLERGRAKAYVRCKSMLRDWMCQFQAKREDAAREVWESLLVQPFADVLYFMIRKVEAPGAAHVFGNDVVQALRLVHDSHSGSGVVGPDDAYKGGVAGADGS